jgi:hypothetical protein
MTLPDSNFLSAPLWLIDVLHMATLSLHFVAMNFLLGGIVVILWGRITDRWSNPTVQLAVTLFPSIMAATVTLGVAPLLFVQLVYPRQVYSASIVSGGFWLLIVPVVIATYYLIYGAAFSDRPGRKALYLSLALPGLLYVSFIYSSVFSLAEMPDRIASLYGENQTGWVINPDIGEYLFRWLHMILGAVTVGGFFIGLLGRGDEQGSRVGGSFFLWGMAGATVTGFLYLATTGDHLVGLMRSPAIWALAAAILLASGSFSLFMTGKLPAAGVLLFLSLAAMVVTRHYLRLVRLADHFDPATIRVAPQWSVFALFLVCFVLALGVLAYMHKLFLADRTQDPSVS